MVAAEENGDAAQNTLPQLSPGAKAARDKLLKGVITQEEYAAIVAADAQFRPQPGSES